MTRIVAVDDDAVFLDLLDQAFEFRQWELIPCNTSSSAVDLIDAEQPDVVLLDLWLDAPPSGVEVLRALKGSPSTQAIPIICCSGLVLQRIEDEAWLQERCACILSKPFGLDELFAAVDSALELAGTDVPAANPLLAAG